MSGRGGGGGGRGRSQRGGRGGRGGRGVGPEGTGGGRGGVGPEGTGGPGGRGRGGGRGPSAYNVPSPSIPAPSAVTAQSLNRDIEQKLTLQPSSSTQPGVESPVSPPASSKAVVESPVPPASSKAIRFPSRPGYGSIGQKCVVRANHFLVEIAERDLHHYDVTITPEVISKKICRLIMEKLVSDYQQSYLGNRMLAYDGGKSAYTAGELPFSSKDFVVRLADNDGSSRRDREFKVSIKFATKHSLYHLQQFLQRRQLDCPQETIQVLDVALRTKLSSIHQVVGRSFFSDKFEEGHLADGLDYWKGFYQSLRPCQMGLSLNIDVSARAFYEPILVSEYVKKLVRDVNRPLSDQDRIKIKRDLRGVKVEFNHLDHIRRYKIAGLSTQPANQLMFELDGGERTSVGQYFRQKYNIVLKHPMLPAIQSGSDARPVYLPMEVCKIVKGQRYTRKLNERQVTQLLRATCKRPPEREAIIKGILEKNKYNNDKLVTEEFGMQLRTELTVIDARVLPPPMLKYHESGRESRVDPRVGQWNMINKKMVDAAVVEFWTCINFSRCNDPDRFCGELIEMCCSKGMDFSSSPLIPIRSAHPSKIEKTLIDIHKECTARIASMKKSGNLQLLIIILPDVSGSYGKIKRICETELGIVSQCCQPRQATKFNNKQYLENVSLKINVKVGGRNCFLELAVQRKIPYLTDRPTIIFGADVTHPQPGEDSSASIAAVVASMDWPQVTKYRGLVSAQQHREEIIQGLYKTYQDPQRGTVHGGMIRELLIEFSRSTGHKPDRIIFYRDGVSEGQFSQVLLEEMDAIRKACSSLEANYLPPITFVVVQKRHHTRLFPAAHGDRRTTDKSGNILPGTVVDTKICHPTEFDFYLCSHAGIQGTSRPAHYHVLFDENRFTADALQHLTNCLCYTYARCTKSVSIVPPAYYAHLAAFRARYYVEEEVTDGSSGTGGGKATREKHANVKPLPVIKDNVKAVMFYC